MSEISDKIFEYIFRKEMEDIVLDIIKQPVQPLPPTRPGAPSTPLQAQPAKPRMPAMQLPRTPAMLPHFGVVDRARAEQQQARQNLIPVKKRELVHDKKTGKVYYRTRTIYVKPGEMQEKDPRNQAQAYNVVIATLTKILNTGMKQISLDDLDALIARVRGKKSGNWPQINEKLLQLRAMLKKKDWRTSEWILQSVIAICRNSVAQLLNINTGQQQRQQEVGNA